MLTSSQINLIKDEKPLRDKHLSSIFYALGDPGRLKAIKALLKYEEDICVSEFAAILNVSVPAASRQLKILEQASLVVRERKGQMICYQINKENPLVKAVTALFQAPAKSQLVKRY